MMSREERQCKIIGLVTSLLILVIYPIIWAQHNSNNNYFQIIEKTSSPLDTYYPEIIGVDSISLYMIGITIILIPICILST